MVQKRRSFPDGVPAEDLSYYKGNKLDMIRGVMKINGVPTKHYLQPEIEALFNQSGLSVQAVEKVEYDWSSEFSAPPKWLGEPFPWDWLVECGN